MSEVNRHAPIHHESHGRSVRRPDPRFAGRRTDARDLRRRRTCGYPGGAARRRHHARRRRARDRRRGARSITRHGILVSAPRTHAGVVSMQRGWISVESLQLPNGRMAAARSGQFMVRGFGQAGGTLFSASQSFDAIVGDGLNSVFGGGGQLVFPSGVFAQVSLDRFNKTGTRALVSGNQVFTLEIPNRLTITSVLVTAGYRVESTRRVATYFGGGAGWHTLDESSPTVPGREPLNKRSVGYHVLGGVEYPMLAWLWIGGEVQWATVPEALGRRASRPSTVKRISVARRFGSK